MILALQLCTKESLVVTKHGKGTVRIIFREEGYCSVLELEACDLVIFGNAPGEPRVPNYQTVC